MPEFLRSVLSFIVVLGVLVFIHELGHYLAARWRGVHVEAFSIGFGQALFSWTDKVGTVWKIAWIPLGGYVKLHGQERPEDVTPEDLDREREVYKAQALATGKPPAVVEKIAEGKMAKFYEEVCLLEQPFIKDTGNSVAEHIKAAVASLGGNIQIRRFIRYNLGEGIEKKSQDFAAEVAAQTGK